jgi:hypothetical protein
MHVIEAITWTWGALCAAHPSPLFMKRCAQTQSVPACSACSYINNPMHVTTRLSMQAEYTKAAQPLDTLAWPTSRRIESGHSLRVDAAPRSVGQRPMMLKTNEKPVRTARHADWSKLSKAAA